MTLRRGAFLKRIRRRNHFFLAIDPHPYLGFAIVMLCIFMTAEPHVHTGHYIDLAVLTHGRKILKMARYDSITIAIARDGSVYFRNTKVQPEGLPNLIRDAVLNGSEKRVYFKVDARAQYRDVSALLPFVRLAGIQDVTFPVQTPQGDAM